MFEYLRNEDGTNVPVCKEVKTTAASYEVGDALVFDASTGLLRKALQRSRIFMQE